MLVFFNLWPSNGLAAQQIITIPPLRLAVAPDISSLDSAMAWAQLSTDLENKYGVKLDTKIVKNNEEGLKLLTEKLVEVAVIDPLVYINTKQKLKLLGSVSFNKKQYERYVLIVGKNTIIHKQEDLWRARFVLAGSPGMISWDYPLYYFLPDYRQIAMSINHEDDYEGVLLSIAMNKADAGFVPEAFLKSQEQNALGLKVRELLYTDSYPLNLLVCHDDIQKNRLVLIKNLLELSTKQISLYPADIMLLNKIEDLRSKLIELKP